jgi:hypothetical protein
MSRFTLTSRLCIIHAASLLLSTLFLQVASSYHWWSVSSGLLLIYDVGFWCMVAWPLWYIVVPLSNRGQRGRAVLPLVVGTLLWIYPAFVNAVVFLFMHGRWH